MRKYEKAKFQSYISQNESKVPFEWLTMIMNCLTSQ